MTRANRDRLRELFRKVRPIVEARSGRGALTEARFIHMCDRGIRLMRRLKTERRRRDPLVDQLDDLTRRVERLEHKL